MPTERSYDIVLEDEIARVRVRYRRTGNTVTAFTVQLEAWHARQWMPVRRYDAAHGKPHIDHLDRRGRMYDKQWLSMTNNDAMTFAVTDIKANWRRYLAEFEGR